MKPELNKYKSIIFLDVDGVLNFELFYKEKFKYLERFDAIPFYKTVKKYLRKLYKAEEISDLDYYKSSMSIDCIKMLNTLCEKTNSAIVLSASMRSGHSVEELQEIFNYCGATFTIIDKTPHTKYERGTEISKWLKDNCMEWFGVHYFDFYDYVIIDDDNDFLIKQSNHLFQTDNYCGLTPTIIENIRIFFTHKTFEKC